MNFRDPKILFWSFAGFLFLLNVFIWLWMYFKVPSGTYPLIIYYNIYFGQDLLGSKPFLFQIPATGLIMLFANIAIAWSLFEKKRSVAWVVLGATLAMQLVILYASGIIIYVNI